MEQFYPYFHIIFSVATFCSFLLGLLIAVVLAGMVQEAIEWIREDDN